MKDLPYTYMTADNFGMIADVNAIENSIGYISLSQLLTQRIAISKSYILIKVYLSHTFFNVIRTKPALSSLLTMF